MELGVVFTYQFLNYRFLGYLQSVFPKHVVQCDQLITWHLPQSPAITVIALC